MRWQEWRDIASNEALWTNHAERGLLKAEHLHDYVLRLWFEEPLDVSIYDIDLAPLLFEDAPGAALLPLREAERFKLVKGDYALVWFNPDTGEYVEQAIDLAPECLRFFCERYGKQVKVYQQRAA